MAKHLENIIEKKLVSFTTSYKDKEIQSRDSQKHVAKILLQTNWSKDPSHT
jgi:hypothetical protein